ncbi:unnamed protein product [Didymodactylos carnosus]|uniref:PARP n=1 Tax=Didymodactylos carnosus TaxID=1234261 RepID=A0A8S2HSN7_9BILA|nr:unnamed protein product [Didymodactylos carnosus]CAF3680209.1 unnamed protein product [Didymodactylos carnosus]
MHGINGRCLLTVLDENTLEDIGITSTLQKRTIMMAINDIKHITSPSSLTTNPFNVLSKTTVDKTTSFSSQFNGDFNVPLAKELVAGKYPNVTSCQLVLDGCNQARLNLVDRIRVWLGSLPSSYKIDQIEVISNSARYRMFTGQMEVVENRQDQPAFQPRLSEESSPKERLNVLERLDSLCNQVAHNRKARIVRMWHGCKREILSNLLSDGFATLGTLDAGWYGKAMYFTSSAKYAARYSGECGCLILCYVLILNPFPVVASDAPLNVAPEEFRFYGKGNYRNYQCHYIPVSPVGNQRLMNYRPPPAGIDHAMFDELAIFQEANILPQIVVHFK